MCVCVCVCVCACVCVRVRVRVRACVRVRVRAPECLATTFLYCSLLLLTRLDSLLLASSCDLLLLLSNVFIETLFEAPLPNKPGKQAASLSIQCQPSTHRAL